MKDRRWLTMIGFLAALAWLVNILLMYVDSYQYGGVMLVNMNYFGEWGLELVLIAVSIPLIFYAMIDYIRKIESSESGE